MSKVIKNVSTINILEKTSVNENTSVKTGYVLLSESNKKKVGGVYEKGNVSRSLVNLSKTGTLIGCFTLEDFDVENTIQNYLTSLVPGLCPKMSGRWSETEEYYDLQKIIDRTSKGDEFFCKVLGLGLGEIGSYRVSYVSRSGCSTVSTNTVPKSLNEQGISLVRNQQTLLNYSNFTSYINAPLSLTGANAYIDFFDWLRVFDIQTINGSNNFPFFGWAGTRIGSIKPQTFQFQQNSLYNYPASLLNLSKNYNPLGIVYAGQGVQFNSFPISNENKTFEERNDRTYQQYILNNKNDIEYLGIIPYQQGRGVTEIFNRQITYSPINGLVDYVEIFSEIASEGAIPGRNNSFIGVCITDYWSDNLDLNSISNTASTFTDDTRKKTALKQTKTAHNSPLAYLSSDEKNTENPLPWNSLLSYIGTTTSSASNQRSENTPIMKEGVTTMCISGAFPVYRGSHSSRWGGFFNPFTNDGCVPYSQYYISKEFWPVDFEDPSIPQIKKSGSTPVAPNPPYRIKGVKIILPKGQRIKAGSYVYSTMNGVGNTNMSQFYAPAAKDIVLNQGERDQLLGDIYSKYQSNQGGLIVMVSVDGQEPPNPPSCAQPVGVILEEIVGFGEALYVDNDPAQNLKTITEGEFEIESPGPGGGEQQKIISTRYAYDFEKTNFIQSRDILIKFFPMYSDMALYDVTSNSFGLSGLLGVSVPITVTIGDIAGGTSDPTSGTPNVAYKPISLRIKSNYMVNAGSECMMTNYVGSEINVEINGFGLKEKQQGNGWPSSG